MANKIVQLTDASGNNIYPVGYIDPSSTVKIGMDTSTVLGSGALSTFTAPQDCWCNVWGYSWGSNKSSAAVDGVIIYGGEDGTSQSTQANSNVPGTRFILSKGQVLSKTAGTIYFTAYGCK